MKMALLRNTGAIHVHYEAHGCKIGKNFVHIAMCAEYEWHPTADDLIFRATIIIGETDEEAQDGVSRYWSSRGIANSTPAARAVTGLAGRLRGSSMASSQTQNVGGTAGSPAASGVNMNFVGNPDTVSRQIKQYRDECGLALWISFSRGLRWSTRR
jgi:alkanesulfonate monooxygenase SsuD/methylene tetrahydromethanopterin reductase-like flavin-dependent oxidoreductase (luciferase family)